MPKTLQHRARSSSKKRPPAPPVSLSMGRARSRAACDCFRVPCRLQGYARSPIVDSHTRRRRNLTHTWIRRKRTPALPRRRHTHSRSSSSSLHVVVISAKNAPTSTHTVLVKRQRARAWCTGVSLLEAVVIDVCERSYASQAWLESGVRFGVPGIVSSGSRSQGRYGPAFARARSGEPTTIFERLVRGRRGWWMSWLPTVQAQPPSSLISTFGLAVEG
ncbi:hypothetical protein D9611_005312 [Ephemerocybe angulata]|uniref:Uncharacterized protein n=1 Tax=Ephemerocybe angulata TaxID=980116 RepID=A0A8H5C0Q0_9AGAR|nr:hypothetical protein D9611_005312 [Tulosesus angulatus]